MKHILVIRFSALGDVAMLAPVLRLVAAQHRDCHYTVLSQPFCEPLFDDCGENVSFIGRNIKSDYKGIAGLYRLFRELHQMHFDEIVDEHDVLRTKVLRLFFRLHGYTVRKIDKHRQYRREITAPQPKKKLRQLPTSFENYAEALGEKVTRPSSLVTLHSSPQTSQIGIAPFAAHEGKIYPLDKMEEVVSALSSKEVLSKGVKSDKLSPSILLFGGKGKEEEIMRQWADKYDGVMLASDYIKSQDKTPCLREELQLMKQLSVMISMDSANMHLASLVGTRVISIWGATHPYAGFLGWGQRMEDCIQRDLPCRPCSIYGNKKCIYGDYRCMDISPFTIRV